MEPFETRVKQLGLEGRDEFSINEFAMISGLSRVWVRRALTKGKKPATKRATQTRGENVVPKWWIPIDTASVWYNEVKEKQELKELRYSDPGAYAQRLRPSERAIDMLSKKLEADTELTSKQKELMLKRFEAYRAQYQKAYEDRKAKK